MKGGRSEAVGELGQCLFTKDPGVRGLDPRRRLRTGCQVVCMGSRGMAGKHVGVDGGERWQGKSNSCEFRSLT